MQQVHVSRWNLSHVSVRVRSVPAASSHNAARIKIGLVTVSILNKINTHNYFVFYSCIETTHKPGSDTTVGDRSRNLKFPMHHQAQSMESSSNEREREECIYIPL